MKRLFSIKYTDNGIAFASLILRLGLGILMIPHGYDKLIHFASLSSRFPDPFHVGHSTSLCLVIFAEFFCAVFVSMGLFTRLACIPLIIDMSVAISTAHKGNVFGDGQGATLFLIGFLALLFTGPGKVSLDKLIGK